MGYDEFERKLKDVKADFLESQGREAITLAELDDFLRGRRTGRTRNLKGSARPSLKSLKGLSF